MTSTTGYSKKGSFVEKISFIATYLFHIAKSIEIIQGCSLSSVLGSTSRIEPVPSNYPDDNLSTASQASTGVLYRPTTTVSHHRSNTVPARYRKSPGKNSKQTHLSPSYTRNESKDSFSPLSLRIEPKARIRIIDDHTDDGESRSSNIIKRVIPSK